VIAASIFDHPAILLLFAFVALVRWLVSKSKSQRQNPASPPPPPSRPITRGGETQTEEERVRRFLEALGQPPGSTPPKVVTQRRVVQPKIFPNLPPLKTKPPPLPEVVLPPPALPFETTRMTPAATSSASFEVHDVARQVSSEPVPTTRRAVAPRFDPRIKLGTPQDLRTAIVLREIFGPPRSLQSFDPNSVV
jgi:hypothetical protein